MGQRRPAPRAGLGAALAAMLLRGGLAAAQPTVVESFGPPALSLADGQQLGACGQLVARLAAGGSIAVPGSGQAALATPKAAAAAILASAAALPSSPYTVRVDLAAGLDYFASDGEQNGVLLAALTTATPQPGAESGWRNQLALAIWLDNDQPDGRDAHILYWDAAATLHNWDGAAFKPASVSFTPALTLLPDRPYSFTIERRASEWRITAREGQSPLAEATVAWNMPRAGPHWFVVGDAFTDAQSGRLELDAIALPRPAGCAEPSDAGIADGDGPAPLDGGAVDGPGPTADALPLDEPGALTDGSGGGLGYQRIPRREDDGCSLGHQPAGRARALLLGLLAALALLLLRTR